MDPISGPGSVPLDAWYPPIPARDRALRRLGVAGGMVVAVGALITAVTIGSHRSGPAMPTAKAIDAGEPAAPRLDASITDPCSGLTGDLVTHDDGDRSSPLRLVAALEYAFYTGRDPAAVTSLYSQGVLTDTAARQIADFIKAIPVGTRYCVGARSVDSGGRTVDYDIHEIRPAHDLSMVALPVKRYAMTLSTTARAPYSIAELHARK